MITPHLWIASVAAHPSPTPSPCATRCNKANIKPGLNVGLCPLYLQKRTKPQSHRDVRLVPCVDGSELARLFFTFAGWSVQPCVRPICAVHMTAGHNALRGSGPGQKPAFEDALAQVGCPDRRIGRLCITCCSPSQPSHHADCWRDLDYTASATGSL